MPAAVEWLTPIRGQYGGMVEVAFDAWARWARDRRAGLPSPAWLMMQSKRIGLPARSTVTEVEMPPNVMAVDTSVAHLDPELGRVFKVFYLRYAPLEAKAWACRLGTRRNPDVKKFKRLLNRGRLNAADEFLRIVQQLD